LGELVELACEETVRRPAGHGLVHVHDDAVEALFVLLEIRSCVNVDELGATVVKCSLVPCPQMLATCRDRLLVDVHHHRAPHTTVTQDLAKGSPLSAPNHQDGMRIRMQNKGWMNQRLVVNELV
jgi:hypothetical protein